MVPKLSGDIEQAVIQHHGWMEVEGKETKFIIMSMDAYCDMMGVESEEEMRATLKAIKKGLADIHAGRTRPFRDVLAELN